MNLYYLPQKKPDAVNVYFINNNKGEGQNREGWGGRRKKEKERRKRERKNERKKERKKEGRKEGKKETTQKRHLHKRQSLIQPTYAHVMVNR